MSEISVKNVDKITDFETVYNKFIDFLIWKGCKILTMRGLKRIAKNWRKS